MLKNTFCHIQKIGPITEIKLWNAGIHDWELFIQSAEIPLSKKKVASIIPAPPAQGLSGNCPF